MYTLNQVKKILEDIATAHKQINSFGFGDIWEYASADQTHPIMWTEITASNISISDKVLNLSLSLYFMDLVNKSERNETEVLSDQLLIATDVISLLNSPTYQDLFFVESSSGLDHFTEKTDNEVSGWKCDITLRIPYVSDTCYVPSSEITPDDGSCLPVSIINTETGLVITTVPSGGEYEVLVFSGIDGGNSSTVYSNSIVDIP